LIFVAPATILNIAKRKINFVLDKMATKLARKENTP
jgi:hypothetical protein